ncbi:hypothetical protein UA08_08572 [Talaromyces atroroseus]|uniref:MARVEL domain-containing protein n=1 Tax=Talaromyces atroroseus TaxID=1441469 RepID=A0A1Q5Q818_TALAT|nr:hypothetical protein UA08_08572 [Talaromyces atroroseus]OKL56294.1 hypothetical protein UA08_08572 [Talaromyces atroroseus]
MRSRQNHYAPGSFHGVRAFLWVSTLIVTAIMIDFAVNLHSGGFKLPYAFLLILITCLLTLLGLMFTTLFYCRNGLRPMLSLTTNIILFILWALSVGFLGYSMRGTLNTTCNTSLWGTSTGVMVCRVYKVLFSFMVVALAFTFFHIILDIVARRDRANMGPLPYDSMHYREDYKLHARGESGSPLALGAGAEDEFHRSAGADTRSDAYNALGTTRQENTVAFPDHHLPQQQQYEDAEYYDGIPDIPPVSGVRWAPSATGRPSPYSPLQTRFDEQQAGYESYRPHQTPYDEGGYGYRQ